MKDISLDKDHQVFMPFTVTLIKLGLYGRKVFPESFEPIEIYHSVDTVELVFDVQTQLEINFKKKWIND